MPYELENFGKTVNAAAYEMALALANNDLDVITPEKLLAKIDAIFPACLALLTDRYEQEKKKPSGKVGPLHI